MTSPFDLLGSASFLVADHEQTASAIQEVLGVPPPKPHWIVNERGRGIRVTFLRPTESVVDNPTPIEIVTADFVDPEANPALVQPHLSGIAAGQGDRAVKVHATDIATSDIEDLIERVRHQGRRHWVHRDHSGAARVWIGVTASDPGDYRRDGDGGLHLEFLPTGALRLPDGAFDAAPAALGPRSRSYLVDDLQEVLDEIESTFDWQPDDAVDIGDKGSRRAVLGFRCVNSTRLVLLQPAPGTSDGDALLRWGPGPWSLTLAVTDFDAPSRTVRIDHTVIPGAVFDLVDAPATDR